MITTRRFGSIFPNEYCQGGPQTLLRFLHPAFISVCSAKFQDHGPTLCPNLKLPPMAYLKSLVDFCKCMMTQGLNTLILFKSLFTCQIFQN